MSSLRRRFGFWGSIGRLKLSDLAAPEFAFGALLGGGGGWYLAHTLSAEERVSTAQDFLLLAPALLGIGFAAFALIIALMSDQYLRLLQQTKDGVLSFLSPFVIATGLQAGTILATVAYRAAAVRLPHEVEVAAFIALCVLFTVSVLDVVALARSVLMHGMARAAALEIDDLEQQRGKRRDSETG